MDQTSQPQFKLDQLGTRLSHYPLEGPSAEEPQITQISSRTEVFVPDSR